MSMNQATENHHVLPIRTYLAVFAALAISGFYPLLVLKSHLSGYLLMLHSSAGGAFAGCMALIALTCGYQHCLVTKTGLSPARKVVFWLAILLAIPVILSIILSMFPLFGTHGQEMLLLIHRYCAILFALVGVLYAVMSVAPKK